MKKKSLTTRAPSAPDINVLESKALSKMNAGQYKEATDLYKNLLKHANHVDWRQALARCYLQRALAFAAKGMVKEALVLWENYAQNAEPPHEALDRYISWLLLTNDMTKVKNCLAQLSAQQLDEHYPELAGLLGLLIITDKVSCQDLLPKDSAFMKHLGFVQEALRAYRNNKLEDIEPALKKLPFRSAFRDFRTLMKAALLLAQSVEQTQALLAKIPVDSPYQQAGAMLLAVTHSGAALVNDLSQLTQPQIKIIEAVKNFNKKQIELLDVLSKQKDRLSDKVKFNLAIQYQALFGTDSAKNYCRAALSTYSGGQRDFTRQFGAMDNFEAWRIKALSYERNRDFQGAEYYWQQGITALKTLGTEGAFKIALIMRHIAAHQEMPEEVVSWLIDSLEHDPDDRESYVKILQYYERQEQETNIYKEWLDKSIKKFPNDVELLGLAIKASVRNKAFKKATQYAKALLKIDPVNTFAKQVLFTSHLAHARKLIKSKKFHLVEKEIQQAEQIIIGKRYQAQAELMKGFFVFVTEDKKQGAQLIAESVQKLNDGLACAYFCATLEALLLDLQSAPVLKELPPLAKDYVLPQQEMAHLIKLIQQYSEDDNVSQALLHKALEKIKAGIKQSIKDQDYSEEILLSLCQCLERIQHFELLRVCVKIAQPLWKKPIWMYYRVYAEVNGNAGKCSYMNYLRLRDSLENAQNQKDQRAIVLIGKFLDEYREARNPSGFNIFDSLFGGIDEEDEDPIDDLFGHLPDDLYDQLAEKTVEITKKNPPERMLKILAAEYFSNDEARMRDLIFNNPDAMFAFLMLKAADDLGFDIGVTAEQIAECFKGQKATSKPTSFPFF
ncbi:MAG: tetratricopeptide repeat protein [Gammaproteobacteria bacterium]